MSLRHKFSLGLTRAASRLLRSPPGVLHATGADRDFTTTTGKLDAALNNMSHGPCKFGPAPIAHYRQLVTGVAAAREDTVSTG